MSQTIESQVTQPVHWRVIAAAVAGNAFEVYDFVIYAYFAVYIGQAFFPLPGTMAVYWWPLPPSASDFYPAIGRIVYRELCRPGGA